jgi:hypothetical protein
MSILTAAGMMSEFTSLVAISFYIVAGFFLFFYITKMANDIAAQIVVGFVLGRPISTKHRLLLLYQTWMSYATCLVALGPILAGSLYLMSEQVETEGVKLLAYGGGFVSMVGSLMWLVHGATAFVHYRATVLETERG